MAKKSGTKHHVAIKLSDLNKMFKEDDIIAIPKAFAKDIAYLMSVHSVSVSEVTKDAPISIPDEATPVAEVASETKVQVTETTFEE